MSEPLTNQRYPCAHCRCPVIYVGQWWEHEAGTVACTPSQRTYPPRGTNAAPDVLPLPNDPDQQ
ncbi:hypothetical protein GCM10027589_23160 [Actinocorallia lasiicapitis]